LVPYIKRRLHDFYTFCSVATGTPFAVRIRGGGAQILCGGWVVEVAVQRDRAATRPPGASAWLLKRLPGGVGVKPTGAMPIGFLFPKTDDCANYHLEIAGPTADVNGG
jgi:hypothetical protein